MTQILRIENLGETHPSRAAGGKHRQGAMTAYSFQQLMGFLHDGQVSGKICIQNMIKAEHLKPADKLFHTQLTIAVSKCFSYRQSYCRCYLGHHNFIGIRYRRQKFMDLLAFGNCPYRAGMYALTAHDAGAFKQILVNRRDHLGIKSAMGQPQCVNRLV